MDPSRKPAKSCGVQTNRKSLCFLAHTSPVFILATLIYASFPRFLLGWNTRALVSPRCLWGVTHFSFLIDLKPLVAPNHFTSNHDPASRRPGPAGDGPTTMPRRLFNKAGRGEGKGLGRGGWAQNLPAPTFGGTSENRAPRCPWAVWGCRRAADLCWQHGCRCWWNICCHREGIRTNEVWSSRELRAAARRSLNT